MTIAVEGKSVSEKEGKGKQSNIAKPATNTPGKTTKGTNEQNWQTDEAQRERIQSKERYETKPHGTNQAKITRQSTNQTDGRATRRHWGTGDNHRKNTRASTTKGEHDTIVNRQEQQNPPVTNKREKNIKS